MTRAARPSDCPTVRPSDVLGVPNRRPCAASRSITTFFSSSGSTSRSATSSSAWSRFSNGSCGLATVRPRTVTSPAERSIWRRWISTFAPTIAVPTFSAEYRASRSANRTHSPTPSAANRSSGPIARHRKTRTLTSRLRPEQAIHVVELRRGDRAVPLGLTNTVADRGAVARDGPTRGQVERDEDQDGEDEASQHHRVVEVRERHDRGVVERGPQRHQRRCVEQQLAPDRIEQRIEQESGGHEQRPPEHRGREGDVEQHDQAEHDGVMHAHQGRESEDRTERDSGGDLAGRALRVEGLNEGLEELDERQHGLSRKRSAAIATMSASAVASSCSREPRSLASSTRTSASLDRRFTNTTKRNPNFCSYSSLRRARRRNTSGGVWSRSYLCSLNDWLDCARTRSGRSPMRGCALI